MPACAYPNTGIGVVLRLSTYIDCQARALGEDGFLALIDAPMTAGLLSALVTIFVALIGYRLILGRLPTLGDGVGWMLRLGLVLALVTGWPVFQTLIYRVAVDGPAELAAVLLPAAELPDEGLDLRVQQAYDTMRLGSSGQPAVEAEPPQGPPAQGREGATPLRQSGPIPGADALPQTAAIFAVSTVGVAAAVRVAVGLLLALAPLAILGLLFNGTWGVFSGWLRALGGGALASVATSLVTALNLVMVEGELGRRQQGDIGLTVLDPQGLTTLVLCFAPVMLAALWATTRVTAAFRLTPLAADPSLTAAVPASTTLFSSSTTARATQGTAFQAGVPTAQARAQGVADALAATVQRERVASVAAGSMAASNGASYRGGSASAETPGTAVAAVARRTTGRRTRSAARRDRS